jgi:hypothetical protein
LEIKGIKRMKMRKELPQETMISKGKGYDDGGNYG